MAFKTQQNAPLTDSQLELTAKIGSMKSLLALPFRPQNNIPKDQQISTFDYLLKILRSIGLAPEPVFRLFLEKVFGALEGFLDEKVIEAVGASLDKKGITLQSSRTNASVISQGVGSTLFSPAIKQAMAKELTVMIFGPKPKEGDSDKLVPNSRRNQLIEEAVCSSNMFRLSNNPSEKNQDIQFNRVKLKQQLEAGEVVFEISCQDVKIKLPEDPEVFFTGGGVNTQASSTVTPAQSMDLIVNHVSSEAGKINNENNSASVGKSFFEILIEKLLSYITTLVFPHVGPIFSFLGNHSETSDLGLTAANTLYSNCSIESAPTAEKTAFASSLINSLYLLLLKLLLLSAIKEFKKLVAGYFARTARERQRRKSDKLRMKFNLLKGVADDAGKAAKYAAALKSLSSILDS